MMIDFGFFIIFFIFDYKPFMVCSLVVGRTVLPVLLYGIDRGIIIRKKTDNQYLSLVF